MSHGHSGSHALLSVIVRRRGLQVVGMLVGICVAAPLRDAAASGRYRVVALSRQHAPGTPDGVVFYSIGAPRINTAGEVFFSARLAGDGVDCSNQEGCWAERSGVLTLVLRRGDAAPTGDGCAMVFKSMYGFVFNDAGQISFRGLIGLADGSGSNYLDVWSQGTGSLVEVARERHLLAPGVTDGYFEELDYSYPVFNNAGQVAFSATLSGSGVTTSNDSGLWADRDGALTLIAREGGQVPGMNQGVVFGQFSSGAPVMNNLGQVAFYQRMSGPGIDSSNNHGLWVERADGLELVARQGNQAPGAEQGITYASSLWLAADHPDGWNDAGRVAFMAGLSDGRRGIWSDASGVVAPVAITGDQAPGTPEGVVFIHFLAPYLSGSGQTAFWAYSLSGPGMTTGNDSGIWAEINGSLKLIAREGSHPPGTEPNARFAEFYFPTPTMNDAGQVAFRTQTDGGNKQGIWATDRLGRLHLVVRTDSVIEVAAGDARTVQGTYLVMDSGGQDGRPHSFNERGELAVNLSFADESVAVCVFQIPVPGDLDDDGDVDGADFDTFEACGSGPAVDHDGSEICQYADFDSDGDVDASDFGVFQRCLSGEGIPADADCVE